MRRALIPCLAMLLAACQVAPGRPLTPSPAPSTGTTSAVLKPPPKASPSPGGIPGGAGPVNAVPADTKLVPVKALAGETVSLRGVVRIDAEYAARVGAGQPMLTPSGQPAVAIGGRAFSRRIRDAVGGSQAVPAALIGQDGATMIGQDGATLITDGGSTLVAAGAGNMVAAGAGNLVAAGAGNLITDGGSTVVGAGGAGRLGPGGPAPDGRALAGPGLAGLGLDGFGLPRFGLQQAPAAADPGDGASAATYGEVRPAIGMLVSVVDMRNGLTQPLGQDADGKPVYAVFSDGEGRFDVAIPAALAPFARVVARPAGGRDPRLALGVLAAASEGERSIDDDAASTTQFLRYILARRLQIFFTADPETATTYLIGEKGRQGDKTPLGALDPDFISAGVQAMLTPIQAAYRETGADKLSEARQLELALAVADMVLVQIDAPNAALDQAVSTRQADPRGAAALAGHNAYLELHGVLTRMRSGARALAATQAQPAGFWAHQPWVQEVHLRHPERPYRLERPADVVDFSVREFLAENQQAQYEKVRDVLVALGNDPLDWDRLNMIGGNYLTKFVAWLFTTASGDSLGAGDAIARVVREVVPRLAKAPEPPPAAGNPPELPMRPAVPALAVDTVAFAAGSPTMREPWGLVADPQPGPAGETVLYLSDYAGHQLFRARVPKTGEATLEVVAGIQGKPGYASGPGLKTLLASPRGLALDARSRPPVLYVADSGSHGVRRVSFDAAGLATVEVVIGNGNGGTADGPAATAGLAFPGGVAVTREGDLVVADTLNGRLRFVDMKTPGHPVSTILGGYAQVGIDGPLAKAGADNPVDVQVDPADGSIWFLQAQSSAVRQITGFPGPNARVTTLAGAQAVVGPFDGYYRSGRFRLTAAMARDAAGRWLVTDPDTNTLRAVTPDRWVITLAGNGPEGGPPLAPKDGVGTAATLSSPHGIAIGPDGTVFVADRYGGRLRRLRPAP